MKFLIDNSLSPLLADALNGPPSPRLAALPDQSRAEGCEQAPSVRDDHEYARGRRADVDADRYTAICFAIAE
jgi:hypothetical protein